MIRRLLAMLIVTCTALAGRTVGAVPPGGAPVAPADPAAYALHGSRLQLGRVEIHNAASSAPFAGPLARVSTQDGSGNEWDVQLRADTTGAVRRGDVLLARFALRCTESMTGEGFVGFVFEANQPPHEKAVEIRLGAAADWQECFVPFRAARDFPAGQAQVCFRVGYDRQTIELGGISVVNYGPDLDIEKLPRTRVSYAGRAPDAPWRQAAAERIEKFRKGDLTVKVVDSAGRPVPNATVRAALSRHAFGFGSCVTVEHLLGDSPDAQKYREIVEKHFNRAVFENDMKWPAMWDGIRPELDRATDWLLERNIQVRGHNLHWPSWRWSPRQLREFETNPDELRRRCADRVTSAVAHFKGKLIHWDVVNEPYNNRDLLQILGEEVMVDWFKLARAADAECKLYLNDFGIFDGGPGNEHRAHFYRTIQTLRERGAPIDGIGIQSHFGSSLPPPAQLVAVLDQFAAFGLPIESTELSLNMDDPDLQAEYTRDYLTAVFSHPAVEGIMLWGFWEGRHWRPRGALWTTDWQLRPHGKAWLDLVHGQWKTDATLQTNDAGQAKVRGFLGEYDVTITSGDGRATTARLNLSRDGATLQVKLP